MNIGNKVIKCTQYTRSFIKENGQFCTLVEFNTRFGTTVDYFKFTFSSCTSSIKKYIKMLTIFISNNMANEVNVSLSTIYSAPKGTRLLQYSRK